MSYYAGGDFITRISGMRASGVKPMRKEQQGFIPDGWLTIEQAADVSGLGAEEIRRFVRRIKKDKLYTIFGLPSYHRALPRELQGEDREDRWEGSALRRTLRGKTILNADMVERWKIVPRKQREMEEGGYPTVAQVAKEWGVDKSTVRRALRRVHKATDRPPGATS
jgi:hypothetical protein